MKMETITTCELSTVTGGARDTNVGGQLIQVDTRSFKADQNWFFGRNSRFNTFRSFFQPPSPGQIWR